MLICAFLGFISVLPLFILLIPLQAWLSISALDVKALDLFALWMFPYTLEIWPCRR